MREGLTEQIAFKWRTLCWVGVRRRSRREAYDIPGKEDNISDAFGLGRSLTSSVTADLKLQCRG